MSLIDWSDPDEMLGLLIEYVADEATAADDAERADFLQELRVELEHFVGEDVSALEQITEGLREIRLRQPREFLSDPVLEHVDACIEELERIARTR